MMALRILAIALSLLSATAAAQVGSTQKCLVKKVWDGDTFDAQCVKIGAARIRLYQVDAPEKSQHSGKDSLHWLESQVLGKTVSVRIVSDESPKGALQQRWVSVVIHQRKNINLMSVSNGWSWAAPGFTKPGDKIRRAHERAKAAGLGLWSNGDPVAPWDWRHGKRHA